MDLSKQRKYRVYLEESYGPEKEDGKTMEKWRYWELRGKYGEIYPYSDREMAVNVTGIMMCGKFRRDSRLKLFQDCEGEATFKFDQRDLDYVAGMIKARKRKVFSPEALEKMKERMKSIRKNLRMDAVHGSRIDLNGEKAS